MAFFAMLAFAREVADPVAVADRLVVVDYKGVFAVLVVSVGRRVVAFAGSHHRSAVRDPQLTRPVPAPWES